MENLVKDTYCMAYKQQLMKLLSKYEVSQLQDHDFTSYGYCGTKKQSEFLLIYPN